MSAGEFSRRGKAPSRSVSGVFLLGCFGIGVAVAFPRSGFAALAFALLVVLLVWNRPMLIMSLALWISVLRGPLVDGWILPRAIALVADLVIIIGTLRLIWLSSQHKAQLPPYARMVALSMLTFCAVALLSGLVNQVSPLDAIGASRALLFGPLSFLFFSSSLVTKNARLQVGVQLWVALALQVPFALWQYAHVYKLSNPDLVVGTFGPGGANVLGLASLLGIAFLLSRPPSSWDRRNLVLGALLVIPLVLSSSRFAQLMAIPVAVWIATLRGISWKRIAVVAALLGLIGVGMSLYYSTNGRDYESEFQVATVLSGITQVRQGNVPRLAYFAFIAQIMRAHPGWMLIGSGPGTFASGYAIAAGTPLASDLATQLRLVAGGLSASGYVFKENLVPVSSQVASTWSEYGVLGLVAYASSLLGLLAARLRGGERHAVVGFSVIAIAITLLGVFWGNLWELQGFSVLFWLMLALDFSSHDLEPSDASV